MAAKLPRAATFELVAADPKNAASYIVVRPMVWPHGTEDRADTLDSIRQFVRGYRSRGYVVTRRKGSV